MNDLINSQILSLDSPQYQIDRVSQEGAMQRSLQLANEEIFMKVLSESMENVHQTLATEKEDLDREEEEEEAK